MLVEVTRDEKSVGLAGEADDDTAVVIAWRVARRRADMVEFEGPSGELPIAGTPAVGTVRPSQTDLREGGDDEQS